MKKNLVGAGVSDLNPAIEFIVSKKRLLKMGREGWGCVGANGFKTIITIFVNVIRVNSIKIISK